MHMRTSLVTALSLLATLVAPWEATALSAPTTQPDELRALDGEWIFVEDRTEGRALEQLTPPMSSKFSFRIEEGAVILARGHGSGHRDVRVALDGSVTEVAGVGAGAGSIARYRGEWKDGALTCEVDFVRAPGQAPEGLIRRQFRITPDGLLVQFRDSVGLYRHAQDIPLPAPAKAVIGDLTWLAGSWVGNRGAGGSTSIEERWSPPLGGAMLGMSRTVRGGKMSMFEYLRIVEREGGLVYVAQPGGAAPTEFVLTQLGTETSPQRAVFDNPRHDYPKRIIYELSADGVLSATIGFTKGGTPQRFELKRE